MTGPRPSDREEENARLRAEIAARQAAECAAAQALADEALGPGWVPWMRLSLIDADHRRTGDTAPAATAYKVCRGGRRRTEEAAYVRRMPDGSVRHAADYEELFGEMLSEPHPTRTDEVRGERVPCPRYELCWSALERYAPRSAGQLAAARIKREEKAVEDEARENPLFAEHIRSGAWRHGKGRRGRSPG